jgi:hypothetical protein
MSIYSQAIACGEEPDEDFEEVDCGHDWDMSCPPCRVCGGCPECGDCDCGIDDGDDDWCHDSDMESR